MRRPKGLFLLDTQAYHLIYGPAECSEITAFVDLYAEQQTAATLRAQPALLAEAEVIFSGWGMLPLDEAMLACAPHLQVVFYGAGSIRPFVTHAFWQRGIRVTSAASANALPVAEYTLGAILLSLKQAWRFTAQNTQGRSLPPPEALFGGYGSTVGLISLGTIGRLVRERLRPFDLNVLVYDPFVSPEQASELGVTLVALDELFARADVISLHTPLLETTRGMLGREYFQRMKPWSTFINTARGAIIREDELIAVLRERPDIQAVLDVTFPEPPSTDSPLYTLPNMVLTPHIAGSQGRECRRMGRLMVEELRRYLSGEPLLYEIKSQQAALLA
jgi:phosphoglycerate dehydrogenase-like enzyme